ncbi:MAG: hypothetical protein ACLFQW_09155 [Spirochaetaceae bacterium]
MSIRRIIFTLGIVLIFSLPVFAQETDKEDQDPEGDSTAEETDSASPSFSMQIEIGSQTFNDPGDEESTTYQSLGLKPDIAFGKIGIGLDLTINYRFADDDGEGGFYIREEDWIPEDDQSLLDLYLPIFRYVRYGEKGDPLYGKIGSIEDGTLGNGFIMGNYSNTLFLPERRHVGLALDVDGKLFNFPYLGIETFAGNLAKWDVLGARLYTRPLTNTKLPLLSELQIGSTFAADTEPDAIDEFINRESETDPPDTYNPETAVTMFSFDFFQPLIANPAFTAALYGDAAFQPGGDTVNKGLLAGFGGNVVKFINYSINSLFLGDNFVPFYFDSSYDLYRQQKYEIYNGDTEVDGYTGWLATLGFSFLQDSVVFNTSLSGAFVPQTGKDSTYPQLKSTFSIGEGVLPGVYFDLSYEKKHIKEFSALIDPEDALVGADIYYRAGPAIVNLGYTLRYVPADEDWETTAKLSTSIGL